MHPLIVNLENIKTHELEEKIAELSKKYFLTHNPDLQFQIVSIIDEYKNELYSQLKSLTKNDVKNTIQKEKKYSLCDRILMVFGMK